MRLVPLAAKQANSTSSSHPPSPTNPTSSVSVETPASQESDEIPPQTTEDLEGGKLSDKPKMSSPPTTRSTTLNHDDELLKEKILNILNSEEETCQSKSAQIMDTILEHRRKKVLELDREKIPPATARFISEGGGANNVQQTDDSKTSRLKNNHLKPTPNKSKPLNSVSQLKKPAWKKQGKRNKEQGIGHKRQDFRKEEEKEEEEEKDSEEGQEEDEEEDAEEYEEEGGEEAEEDEADDINGEEEMEHEESEKEREEDEDSSSSGPDSTPSVPNPRYQRFIKTKFVASLSRILASLAKKRISLTDKTINILDSNLDKLSNFLSRNRLFKVSSTLVVYQGKDLSRTPPPSIHVDKLLASLSLPTLSLFRFILASRLTPKRFSPTEKEVISLIVKLASNISLASIPSPKIRAICL